MQHSENVNTKDLKIIDHL